jgi:isoleucyl-tRNA synthetase
MAKITGYEPLKLEPEILEYWAKSRVYEKAKKNAKGEKFYFLDGPPYTSGKVHIGTAWNKSLKDSVLRYRRSAGFEVWDRAGYDMHGMPTENATMKKLKMTHKEEIPKFGVAKFVEECRKLSLMNLAAMNEDFTRLGVWMDFENAYQTIKPEFIEGEWWLVKKAHENNRLYEGEKVMHWCPVCATALAKHELEYKNVTDDSIFLKFKVKGKENEYLIIWTTTPWTIPFNLGVMANPDIYYVRAQVDGETWIAAKALAGALIQGVANKKMKILEEFKGSELEGLEYEHPLYKDLKDIYDDLKKKANIHTVVMSKEYVDVSSGSGLVHMAPGCGPEDYEVGYKYKIPPFNNLDEEGRFPKEMGRFAGFTAKKDDKRFVEALEKAGSLIAVTPVEHEYAHCWRCHNPVIFRTTKQWFFRIEDLIPQMRELNKQVFWQPDWGGNKWFDSWLENLRDNGITRQRYWGTPLPIWRCDKCGHYIVIGSAKELEKYAKLPKDLHRPYIDEVVFPCRKCNGEMKRISDILDVWVDAGTTSWTCLDYPQKKNFFNKFWPADFILEGKDQIRGWFNLLLIASMVSMEKHSYKAVYMHGWTNDSQGRKMSKSVGNYILPSEIIDKWGADTMRYYMIGGANPGLDLNYNFDDTRIKHRNLIVLWNIHKYLIELANEIGKSPTSLNDKRVERAFLVEEAYIISKLHSTIDRVTRMFDEYRLNEVPWAVEELFLDLSRNYIKMVRDKIAFGTELEKQAVLYCIYTVLMDCLKLFTPVAPFVCEKIYLNLKENFGLKEESISMFKWPKADLEKVDVKLENKMEAISSVMQAVLYAREQAGQGLRWPFKEIKVVTKDNDIAKAVDDLKGIVASQTNVKEVAVQKDFEGAQEKIKPDYNKLKVEFDSKTSAKIIANLSTTSPETIMAHIEKLGRYDFRVNGEKVSINRSHLIIERKVPKPWVEAEFKGGVVYINTQVTDELLAEGYAREVMRRVQAARKTAGLDKTEKIALHIQVDEELEKMLGAFTEQIKEKVGAENLKIAAVKPAKKHEFCSKEKVRKKEFIVCFDKI